MIAVRPAASRDGATLARLHERTWREAYWGSLPDAVALGEARDATYWAAAASRIGKDARARDHALLLAEVERAEEPIGYAWAGPARGRDEPWDGEVYMLYVLAAHHRRGVGRALIGAAAAHLVRRGFFHLGVWVVEENGPARAFYESLGGRLAAKGAQTVRGVRVPVVGYSWEDGALGLFPEFNH